MSDEEKKATEEPKPAAEDPRPKARRKTRHSEGKGKKNGGVMTKVIATVFGAVVAPILVAVGVAYLKPQPENPPATQPEKPPPTTKPIREGIVSLITPNLSDNFYTFHYDDWKCQARVKESPD